MRTPETGPDGGDRSRERTILYFQGLRCEADRLNIAGLTAAAHAHGWTVQILAMPADVAAIRSLLRLWRPDGVVGDRRFSGMRAFASIPLVVIGSPGGRRPGYARYVANDPGPTVSLAVEELRRLRCPDYAFAGACTDEPWCAEREGAFRAALARYGLDCRSFLPGAREREDSPSRHKALRAWLATLPKPCALLAANDTVGRSVLAAAKALGIRVPDDLAVCAVDNDTETCLHTSPTLTSVEPDFYGGGFLAGELLVRLAARRADVPLVSTFGALRVRRRESTSPAVVRDSLARKALSLIAAKAASGLTAADVVRIFDCSRRSAEMRFRRATGLSILEAILAERVETAKALLRRPDLKLEAVAALSGWKTYSVFRRHFTAVCGLPPSDWRAAREDAAPASVAEGEPWEQKARMSSRTRWARADRSVDP